jgi:hypothetical protein
LFRVLDDEAKFLLDSQDNKEGPGRRTSPRNDDHDEWVLSKAEVLCALPHFEPAQQDSWKTDLEIMKLELHSPNDEIHAERLCEHTWQQLNLSIKVSVPLCIALGRFSA